MNAFWLELKIKRVVVGLVKLSLFWLALVPLFARTARADAGPPAILVQPADQSVKSGDTIQFDVVADGTEPLAYQWRFNNNPILNATNSALTIPNLVFTNGGNYQVIVSNSQGAVTSRVAFLEVDSHLVFRILNLSTNSLTVIDEYPFTGYPKGGVAASSNYVFVAGRGSSGYEGLSARHALGNLSGGAVIPGNCDALACNLRSGKVYVLANGSSPITYLDYSLNFSSVNALMEINEATGLPTGTRISLSTSIPISTSKYVGIFSGYDRIVIQGASGGYHIYDIALPSGQVTDLGALSIPSRTYSYSWAYWGIAEYANNALSLVYDQSSTTIVRRRVPGGNISTVAAFSNLGYMESLGFSLAASRWYFHIAYNSQFSSYSSTLGTAKATYTTDADYPLITAPPVAQKVYATSNALLSVTAVGAQPLSFQWLFNGTAIPDATNSSLLLTNVLAADSGNYTVQVFNPAGFVTSGQVFLDVVTSPRVLSISSSRSVMRGTNASFSISVDGAPPMSLQWRLNGTNVSALATNASLTLNNIQTNQAGFYTVLLSNRYGTLISATMELNVMAPVDDGSVFQITSLQSSNASAIETYDLYYDYEYGPLAASSNSIFFSSWNGYNSARVNIDNLGGLAEISRYYFAFISNLRSEKVYVLGTSSGPPETTSLGTATHLWEIDGQSGALAGNSIPLSLSIPNIYASSSVGFFSGYDRAIVLNGSRAYSIALPSGVVTDLGPMGTLAHGSSYIGSFWGVAERFGGIDYIVYSRNSTTMSRTRVPDGVLFSPFTAFSNLSSYMSSITVSIRRGRWYFLHRYASQFAANYNSTLGYASATFNINSGPNVDHFEWGPVASPQLSGTPFQVTVYAKNTTNDLASNFTASVFLSGAASANGAVIPIWPSTTANFVNGSWTGLVSVLQASTSMALQADDREGHIGKSANFRVNPLNDLGVTMSAAPSPVVVGQLLTYSIRVTNTGPLAATGVGLVLSNQISGMASFVSATASQGSCSNANGLVICNLGSVSNVVDVSIIVQPTRTGFMISRVTLGRNEVDPDLANNSVSVATSAVLPILTIQDARQTEGNTGTNLVTFTVLLNPAPTNTVSVNYATGNGTAFSLGTYPDFVAASGTLIFPPGSTSQTFTVSILGDSLFELDETFTANLSSVVNGYIGRSQATGTIVNDDQPPVINISDVTLLEGESSTNNAVFNVTLSTMTGAEVTFGYATSNGTATAGSDYVAKSGTLNFAAETTDLVRSISVPVIGDTQPEFDETFYLALTNINNAVGGRVVGVCAIVSDDGIGHVDTLAWSTLPSPQYANEPFTVTVTAKDFLGNTVASFTNTVALSGIIPSQGTNFILPNVPPDNTYSGDWTLGYSFTPNRDLLVTHFRHYFGTKVSLWDDTGTLLASTNFNDPSGRWSVTPLNAPVTLTAGRTYRLAAYTGGGPYYWPATSGPANFDDGVLVQGYEMSGDNLPTSSDTVRWWLVDLGYEIGATASISIVPAISGNFVAGIWSGTVTVVQSGTNMVLQADDGAQHLGRSNPFNVANDIHFTYARVSGTDLQLGFHGAPGATYRLERNDRLNGTNWVSVIEFGLGGSQDIDLFDSILPNNPAQFYRIRLIPGP